MKDYITLGCCPIDETPVMVSKDYDYWGDMQKELERYKELLSKKFPIPSHLEFDVCYRIKWFNHDFGPYGEVVVVFEDSLEEAVEFALNIEGNLPLKWEE